MSEKVYKFNEKVKVTMLKDINGLKKGEVLNLHPTTAELFIEQKLASK